MKRKQAKRRNLNAPVIHIGATAPAVAAVEKSILSVLKTPAGDSVKIEAIKALAASLPVNNTTISGCSFQTADTKVR